MVVVLSKNNLIAHKNVKEMLEIKMMCPTCLIASLN